MQEKKQIKNEEIKIFDESINLCEVLKDNSFLKKHIEEIRQQFYFLMNEKKWNT